MTLFRKLRTSMDAADQYVAGRPGLRNGLAVFVLLATVAGIARRIWAIQTGVVGHGPLEIGTLILGFALAVYVVVMLFRGDVKRAAALVVVELIVAAIVFVRLDLPATQAFAKVGALWAAEATVPGLERGYISLHNYAEDTGRLTDEAALESYSMTFPYMWQRNGLTCARFEKLYDSFGADKLDGVPKMLSRASAYCAHQRGDEVAALADYRMASERFSQAPSTPAPVDRDERIQFACEDGDLAAARAASDEWRRLDGVTWHKWTQFYTGPRKFAKVHPPARVLVEATCLQQATHTT